MTEPVRVVKQDYHRNGIGGDGFIVSLVDWPEAGEDLVTPHFVAVSFTDPDSRHERGEQIEYMRSHTAVLSIDQLMVGDIKNAWRGADRVGPAVVQAWETACLDGTAHTLSGTPATHGYDPFEQEP